MRKDARKSGTSTPSRVRVAVRIRPGTPAAGNSSASTEDVSQSPSLRSSSADHSTLSAECLPSSHAFRTNAVHFNHDNQSKTFTFDHVFPSKSTQKDVYTEALQPLLTPFLNGFNVTVLAYGQTGSGKTYTVGNKTNVTPATSPARPVNPNAESTSHKIGENDGLLPRFLCDLFASLRKEPSVKTIYVSFLEIYCDEVRDLLQQNRAGNAKDSQLVIREDEHKVWVENLRQLQIENVEKALELMNLGRTKQIVSSNALNDTSSRSHAIYTMEVSRKFVNEIKKTKLTFVDLAGSERLKKTQVEGVRMKESIQINVGLLALGNVINALGDDKSQKRRNSVSAADAPEPFVPYRSSKLTRLLRDSLGGNSMTLFIACVSPLEIHGSETLNTLQYANRARSIQNKAEKNVESIDGGSPRNSQSPRNGKRLQRTASEIEINLLQEQICFLKQQLDQANAAAVVAQAVGTNISSVPFPLQNLKKSDDHRAPEQPKGEESALSTVEPPLPVIPVAKVSGIKPPSQLKRILMSPRSQLQLSADEVTASEHEKCRLEDNTPLHSQSVGQEEVHLSPAEFIGTPTVAADAVNSIETKLVESPPESTALEVHLQAEVKAANIPDVQRPISVREDLNINEPAADVHGCKHIASATLKDHSQAEIKAVDLPTVQQPVPMRENLEAIEPTIVAHKFQHNTALQRFLGSFQAKENGSKKSLPAHQDEDASAVAGAKLTPLFPKSDASNLDQKEHHQSKRRSLSRKSTATQDTFNDPLDNEVPPKVSLSSLTLLGHQEEIYAIAENHLHISEVLPEAATWFTELSDTLEQDDTKRAGCDSVGNEVEKMNGHKALRCEMRSQDNPIAGDKCNAMEYEKRCQDSSVKEENQRQSEPQSLLAKLIARRILPPVEHRHEHAQTSSPLETVVGNDPLPEGKADKSIPEYLAQTNHECNRLIRSISKSKSFRLVDELEIEQHEVIDSKLGMVPLPTKQRDSQDYDTRSNQNQDSPQAKEQEPRVDPSHQFESICEPDFVLCRPQPTQPVISPRGRRRQGKSPRKHSLHPMKVFDFDDPWDQLQQRSQASTFAKLESLLKCTEQLKTDEFRARSNQEEEDLLSSTSSGKVEACLERMTVFFEKRNKVKRRLGQLKRRLHQFQLILGFPRPLGDEVELQKYKIAYQEVLLQERVDFCEAIAAQRLYKRLQSWKEAAGSSEFSVSSSNCDEEESIFLSQDQYFGCTEWLTRHLYDREYFQKHMLPLLLNGWIAIMPVDLEKEDSWLAL